MDSWIKIRGRVSGGLACRCTRPAESADSRRVVEAFQRGRLRHKRVTRRPIARPVRRARVTSNLVEQVPIRNQWLLEAWSRLSANVVGVTAASAVIALRNQPFDLLVQRPDERDAVVKRVDGVIERVDSAHDVPGGVDYTYDPAAGAIEGLSFVTLRRISQTPRTIMSSPWPLSPCSLTVCAPRVRRRTPDLDW